MFLKLLAGLFILCVGSIAADNGPTSGGIGASQLKTNCSRQCTPKNCSSPGTKIQCKKDCQGFNGLAKCLASPLKIGTIRDANDAGSLAYTAALEGLLRDAPGAGPYLMESITGDALRQPASPQDKRDVILTLQKMRPVCSRVVEGLRSVSQDTGLISQFDKMLSNFDDALRSTVDFLNQPITAKQFMLSASQVKLLVKNCVNQGYAAKFDAEQNSSALAAQKAPVGGPSVAPVAGSVDCVQCTEMSCRSPVQKGKCFKSCGASGIKECLGARVQIRSADDAVANGEVLLAMKLREMYSGFRTNLLGADIAPFFEDDGSGRSPSNFDTARVGGAVDQVLKMMMGVCQTYESRLNNLRAESSLVGNVRGIMDKLRDAIPRVVFNPQTQQQGRIAALHEARQLASKCVEFGERGSYSTKSGGGLSGLGARLGLQFECRKCNENSCADPKVYEACVVKCPPQYLQKCSLAAHRGAVGSQFGGVVRVPKTPAAR